MKIVAGVIALCIAVLALAADSGGSLRFTNATAKAGIYFVHHSGAQGKKYLPESLGSGVAFTDLDGDGWADILLINDHDWNAAEQEVSASPLSQQSQRHVSPT